MTGRAHTSSRHSPSPHAPDLFEPLLGYRYWRVGADGTLRCLISNDRWDPGPNQAHCWRKGHDAPGRMCTCGFNALHDVPEMRRSEHRNTVLGAIAAWGDIQVHRLGFRAEFASVVALADGGVTRSASRRRLARAADRYGVELAPVGELAHVAEALAVPLDPTARHRRPARPPRG